MRPYGPPRTNGPAIRRGRAGGALVGSTWYLVVFIQTLFGPAYNGGSQFKIRNSGLEFAAAVYYNRQLR